VSALTAEYTRRQQAAADAGRDLAASFGVMSQAEQDQAETDAQARAARARQAARVRALYVEGTSGLAIAMLDADSVQDALWRLSVGRRVGRTVVLAAADDLERARTDAETAVRRSTAANAAGDRLALALGRLQEEDAAAARALAAAKAKLDTLSRTALRLKAAEDAAAALAAAQRAAAAARLAATVPVSGLAIPAEYERAYRAAADTCPGLRWSLLAAVGQVESGHGRNNGPSSAGAVGPMQFMPATFARYGVDGDDDGRADAWDYADAIPTAARYLCASGLDATPDGVRRALLAYNNAQWYVDLVLETEQAILAARPGTAATEDAGRLSPVLPVA
jgi:membrane-bound lytic murein transglycosylase B